jgi:hypothetical protein
VLPISHAWTVTVRRKVRQRNTSCQGCMPRTHTSCTEPTYTGCWAAHACCCAPASPERSMQTHTHVCWPPALCVCLLHWLQGEAAGPGSSIQHRPKQGGANPHGISTAAAAAASGQLDVHSHHSCSCRPRALNVTALWDVRGAFVWRH